MTLLEDVKGCVHIVWNPRRGDRRLMEANGNELNDWQERHVFGSTIPDSRPEAGRVTTDRTGRCDLGCQASTADGEPRVTRRRARPSLIRKSTPEAPNRIALTTNQFHK